MNYKHLNQKRAPIGSTSMGSIVRSETSHVQVSTLTEDKMNDRHLLIEELGVPFLQVNESLHTLSWNQAFLDLTNIKESDMQISSIEELAINNAIVLFSIKLIQKSLQNNCKQEDDFEEDDLLYRVRAIPYYEYGHIYLVYEDRSLQKQFENLLTFHHQMEAVSHIAAGVAHELRNPLSVIKGFLQLAKLTNDHQKYYETIMSELNRMNGILEDFLSVSRRKIDRRLQSPANIMHSLTEIIKAECLLHDVEFNLNVTETNKQVHVNESMVKQVMLNLLRNSVEAYGESNTNRLLTIETRLENKNYVIEIKDNGKGMPDSVLKQLGKPFFTTKARGTGIGIPLCKKIIEDHGGTFQIHSTYNVGTNVLITLPLEVQTNNDS